MSALLIANMDCKMTECLTSDSLGNVCWVQNVPLLHTSKYVIARDYQASPCINTASDKLWGTRLGAVSRYLSGLAY